MRRVKTIILLGTILVFLMGTTSMSYANSYEFRGHCSYNGKKIVSDFSSKDFAASQKNLQPGDSLRYVITYKNNSDDVVDFYMRNKVLETLEEKKDAAENGGYTYVLKNSGPN